MNLTFDLLTKQAVHKEVAVRLLKCFENDQPQKEKDISLKDVAEVHRSMDIVKERGMDLSQILFHDVLKISPLFDGDLPSHTNKSSPNAVTSLLLPLMLW
ncbi:hypothetical protein Pcinc_017383 [Petrolisthes cinctipes]|uniref:Uncharacterized protein n=1 Tax=Petrolisthes cinctipes TaxID=88211 RepID=A0AAE1FQV7_PETCI|nr:hypothetical protein Pcinc_017383 [Petrolisthes cinctipes]